MARNRGAKIKPTTGQQRRSVTKMKTNAFKQKGVQTRSNNVADRYKKMSGNPGQMRKQTKSNAQSNAPKMCDTRQLRAKMRQSLNANNNLQSLTNISLTGEKKRQTNDSKATAETILIEDSDEETVSIDSDENPRPLFYLDRNPGIRDAEVPLYNVHHEIENPLTTDIHHPMGNPDDSIIVLDSTIDQTMNDTMKEMQINGETTTQSSSADNVVASSSSKLITNIQIDTQSEQPVANVLPDVIELSDNSDTEPNVGSASKNTTPAFPAMDCIPIDYDVLKSQTRENTAIPKPQKKGGRNGAANTAIKTSPLPGPILANVPEATKRMVIIDGNNVAYGHLNGKMFSVKGLKLCINYFKRLGHEVTAVVPQFRLKKYHSTDYVLLDKMHREGDVTLAPSKNLPGQCSSTYDDRLILSIAEQFDGVIISNDNFRDLLEISPAWRRIIETRVIGYTWVKDCFFLPDDPYGRYGPTLQQILNGKSQ